jgi:cyclopropane fatty-acyl-phospholipid synthase-like methyltransferase
MSKTIPINNQETLNTWNQLAEAYQDKFMDLDLYHSSYDYFLALLSEKQTKVLELGVGPGVITKYMLNKRPELEWLGIDVAPKMVELARNNIPSARFEVMDVRSIQDFKEGFNAAIAGFCIPYLNSEECTQLFLNLSSLLVKDGIFYVSFVEGNPSNSQVQTGSTGLRVFFNYFQTQWIKTIAHKNHFELNQKFVIQYVKADKQIEEHIVLIFKKKIH